MNWRVCMYLSLCIEVAKMHSVMLWLMSDTYDNCAWYINYMVIDILIDISCHVMMFATCLELWCLCWLWPLGFVSTCTMSLRITIFHRFMTVCSMRSPVMPYCACILNLSMRHVTWLEQPWCLKIKYQNAHLSPLILTLSFSLT